MRTIVLVSFLCFFSIQGCFWDTKPGLPSSVASVSEFEEVFNKLLIEEEVPSASVLVVQGDQTVYQKGFGYINPERESPASSKTVYRWWSITKIFTAMALMQLVEEKALRLSDPVTKYLPFLEIKSEWPDTEVTIEHLLSHSSGIKNTGAEIISWIHFSSESHLNQTDLLKKVWADYNELIFKPGSEGRYSNINYLVLSGVVESITGQAYESYVDDKLIKPMAMTQSGFDYSPSMLENRAIGSHPQDLMSFAASFLIDFDLAIKEKRQGIYWFNPVYPDQTAPSGLLGPSADLAQLLIAFTNDGVVNGKSLLSVESINQMQLPVLSIVDGPGSELPNMKFGLGWFVGNDQYGTYLTHAGSGMAYVGRVKIYPERQLGMLVLANSTNLDGEKGNRILDLLLNVL